MNFDAILARLQHLPLDRLMPAAAGLAVAMLLVLALWLAARRRRARRNIGLRKLAATLPKEGNPVTRAVPKFERPDPLEADRLALEMLDDSGAEDIEDIPKTSYTERVNGPEAARIAAEPHRAPEATVLAPEPRPAPMPEPSVVRSPAPASVPAVPAVPPMPEWEFLQTLPFVVRRGLSTKHADMLDIGVEAVFFPPEAVNRIDDPVLRLAPFLPEGEGELLCRESDRRTFQAGGLYAQPDALIALKSGGDIAVEYKSRGGRMDLPADIAGSLRPKDLLQTVIGAMVLSASEGVACAPVLRTNNAIYFLRPGKAIQKLLAERIASAVTFVKPYSERSGISASDYAELCVVPAQMLSGKPAPSAGSLRGEAAHAQMLR